MEHLITPETAISLDGLFLERSIRQPQAIAYTQYNKQTETWDHYSWQQMQDMISRYQYALSQEQLQKGDRIGILLKNSVQWVAFDIAAMSLGLVVVPFYLDDREDNIAYIIEDANVRVLILQGHRQWHAIKPLVEPITDLKTIISVEALESEDKVIYLEDWLPADKPVFQKCSHQTDNLATIVYTSGTTGRPKGVMLSHHNILSVTYGLLQQIYADQSDRLLSFLPLSHMFERTVGYYVPMMAGARVIYSQSVQHLAAEMIEHQPTILIAVPRIFEQVYHKISLKLEQSAIKKLIFDLSVKIGWQVFLKQQKKISFCPLCWFWPVIKKLAADKILDKFGGKIRIAAAGGAPLPPTIAKTFLGLGLQVLQGYGLTETSPVVSFNRLENNDPQSIGIPLDTIQVKLGKEDELLIKSPGVMQGYWNKPEATQAVIDKDGWFHSGDQARIDPNSGHIFITGRIKDILVMSNGEKIPPADIEQSILSDKLFDNVLLLGEGQAFLSAVLVINEAAWADLANNLNLDPADNQSLKHKKLHHFIIFHLKTLLHDYPGYAKIRRVILTLEPWTIENQLMTPTLKVKRQNVMTKFKTEIDSLYT